MEKLKFSVDKIELKEQIENSQFVRARVRAFSSGDNAHDIPVLETALYKAEKSIYQKPMVYKYNKNTGDLMGHESDEVPCGFVPSQGANITYERSDDGRLFFNTDVLIWKYYSGEILDVFQSSDNKKSVSVEIAILETKKDEFEKDNISDFSYLAITVLGESYKPAITGANAEIIQFSKDKDVVEGILQQSFSNIENEKEGELMENEINTNLVESEEKVEMKEVCVVCEKETCECEVVESEEYIKEEVDYKVKYEELEKQMTEIKEKYSTLENENMELKVFKSNIENQEIKSRIEFAIGEVSDILSDEQINEWRDKVKEFSTVDDFSNAIKAFAFTLNKGKKKDEGITRMSIPLDNNNNIKNSTSIWERI